MRSVQLAVKRLDLLGALQTLGVTRRRRFSSTLPVWLRFDPGTKTLQIVEDRGAVTAHVSARGTWLPVGATVDLFMLKRAVTEYSDETVELHAVDDAVILEGGDWHVRLQLLGFGPEGISSDPTDDLPLFRWADRKS